MIKVLILEDEDAASKRLQKLVAEILPEAEFLATIESVKQGVEWFEQNSLPDLIFADVQLNDGTSFDIFRKVEVKNPVIFTTAYDEHALNAFKLNSVDYLLKPVKKNELGTAIEKFKYLHLAGKKNDNDNLHQLLLALQKTQQYKQRFVLRIGEHMKIVEVPDIAYFYTENKANFIITKDNKRYLADNTLDQLESMLDPKLFFRINRQFIVSYPSIAEMFTYSKARVLLKLNPPSKLDTIVSTERSAAFKSWLGGE
ncbi:MAG TPA: LytTR family DNA-binding domain-containing protein [Parafilimonas sp.]|nr:LytTR family DNA-binding domain-containing protein [Parafilimonas sp.]